MAIETEIKARLADRGAFRSLLAARGARLVATRSFEDNFLLDDGSGTLRQRGEALRVRFTAGRAILTWKGVKSVRDGVKSREEIETDCADGSALLSVFAHLGLQPVLRYQKYRETWAIDATAVLVDETPIGDFVEIEGSEPEVRRLTGHLGIDRQAVVDESYPTLFARVLAARGEGSSEMVFR
jgi:adenylate cyclase class 2